MTEFLSALVGALLGAFMVFVAELWRQVLSGKAAARFIYVESHYNSLMCNGAAEKGQFDGSLSDDAWRTHGIEVAPLLTAEASELTLITYFGLAIKPERGTAEGLREHSRDFRIVAYWMHRIEAKGRFKILVELLGGQPTLPSASEVRQGIAAMHKAGAHTP